MQSENADRSSSMSASRKLDNGFISQAVEPTAQTNTCTRPLSPYTMVGMFCPSALFSYTFIKDATHTDTHIRSVTTLVYANRMDYFHMHARSIFIPCSVSPFARVFGWDMGKEAGGKRPK